jgi:nucleoside-diphosphate-sugar epimerase
MTTPQKQKILVTGGAGFIGTHLCRKLIDLGNEVSVLDLRKPETVVSGVRYVQGDVRDATALQGLVNEVAVVYHLAALVSVPLCQRDPLDSYSNNFTATIMVLDAIRKRAESTRTAPIRLVFASTAALYGAMGDDGRAVKESDVAPQFSSFYAAQKFASEQAMDQYKKVFGIPSVAFRFFNVFGPGQDPTSPYSGVISIFSKLAKEGKPLNLNAGGVPTRDFISVHDIVTGLSGALTLETSQWNAQPINLGTGTSLSVRTLAEIIREAAGTGSELRDAPAREGDVIHSKADIGRAQALLGFKPDLDLKKNLLMLLKVI